MERGKEETIKLINLIHKNQINFFTHFNSNNHFSFQIFYTINK